MPQTSGTLEGEHGFGIMQPEKEQDNFENKL